MLRLLANRDARLYIGGQTLSAIGDSSLWLAMAVWVRILTGSNSEAGLVFFAFSCGLLLAPVCGVVVDRLPRRPLLAGVNLASAALVCLLLLVHGRGEFWLIYAVMFGYGMSTALITAAQTALLAVMIPRDLLGQANALLQIGSQGTRFFAPLLGAGLLAWAGSQPVVLLDAATFLAAGMAAFALRVREQPAPARAHWKVEFTAGLRYIGRTPALSRLLVTFVASLTMFGFLETICFAIVGKGLHRPPPFLGVVFAVLAVGSIVGALLAAPLMGRASERTTVAAGLLICAGSCVLLTLDVLPIVMAAFAVLGACVVWVDVGVTTLIQRRTPADLVGRVGSAVGFGASVSQVLSIALGAALVAVVNYRLLLVVMAAITAASVAFLISVPDTAPAETSPDTGQRQGMDRSASRPFRDWAARRKLVGPLKPP